MGLVHLHLQVCLTFMYQPSWSLILLNVLYLLCLLCSHGSGSERLQWLWLLCDGRPQLRDRWRCHVLWRRDGQTDSSGTDYQSVPSWQMPLTCHETKAFLYAGMNVTINFWRERKREREKHVVINFVTVMILLRLFYLIGFTIQVYTCSLCSQGLH